MCTSPTSSQASQSTQSERLSKVNRSATSREILPPKEYIHKGKEVEKVLWDAIREDQPDKIYPDWSERYNVDDRKGDESLLPEPDRFLDTLLGHPGLENISLDGPWRNRYYYCIGNQDPFEPVNNNLVSPTQGLLVSVDSSAEFDSAPTPPPKLPNSELLYQAWRDAVALVDEEGKESHIGKLKYIVRQPISNKGSRLTVKDAHKAKGIPLDRPATFTPDDTSFDTLLKDAWHGLLGTRNSKPTSHRLADHHQALGNLVVVAIHTWAKIPGQTRFASVTMELGPASS
ncbi:MAG: hypothetical protein M1823_004381 [Watsoniomyces obsoletus]|nr:MAG: hypothetical protein M1823_004381 [Watsoniomyces obsoletus]